MSVKNFYPQFPEKPYKKTSVDMPTVIAYAKTLIGKYPKEVVRSAYCIFRNESANGQDGVNNNYGGIQADCGVWQGLNLTNVIGTSVQRDGAKDLRRFICFNENGYKDCFEFICYKVQQRKMFLPVETIVNIAGETQMDKSKRINKLGLQVAELYELHWVENPPEDTPAARKDFASLYNSSLKQIA